MCPVDRSAVFIDTRGNSFCMSRYLHRDPLAIVINHVVHRQYEARTGVDDDPRTFVTCCAK